MTATMNADNIPNNLTDTFISIFENMTDTIDDGLQNGINQVVTTIAGNAGIRDQYFLYLRNVCEGDAKIDKCTPYGDIKDGMWRLAQ